MSDSDLGDTAALFDKIKPEVTKGDPDLHVRELGC
jgi:hypothetical protein